MADKIQDIVSFYVKKYQTTNPFQVARNLNILYQEGDLGEYSGCYMFLKNHRYIFLNNNLNENEKRFVMAHELGHAILHKKQNCYFIRNKTLLLNAKIEKEANLFASYLLLPDSDVELFKENQYTLDEISSISGLDRRIVEIRLMI